MVTAVGSSAVPSLQGQIRQEQVQLNDWTTCVSAKTSKGQAAIQKLSGEISAARDEIARALQNHAGSPARPSAPTRPGSVDVWA